MQLTERQEHILRTIVEKYIALAHPVGSAAIVGASGLKVSSATVRNEMAALEALGLIRQLHTSGGRVPTNAGYRYYVERLMAPTRLPPSEAMTIRHQFHQAHTDLQEWLKLAATVMAHRMRNVGLITAPRSSEIKLRHLELISIQPAVALLIVVLGDGTVIQEMLALSEPHSQEELSALSHRLGGLLRGLSAGAFEEKTADLPSLDRTIAGMVEHLLKRYSEQHAEVYHAGLPDLIRQPEFLDLRKGESPSMLNERLRYMLEFLQRGVAVGELLNDIPEAASVHIVIGREAPMGGLEDYSFVLGRYGDDDDSTGILGVVGPTRMEYPRAVALVQYMSDLMTDLMNVY